MGVQAGAARRVMVRQPDKAIDALSSIESSSRQAVSELHQLLGFLRRGDETDDLAPQPGLAQLDDLLDSTRTQGALAVSLLIDGERRALTDARRVRLPHHPRGAHQRSEALERHGSRGPCALRPRVPGTEITDHGSVTHSHRPAQAAMDSSACANVQRCTAAN